MQNRATSLLLSILIVIILLLSACSSNPPVPTVDATQGAQMLAGTYTMTLSAEEIQNAKIPSFETELESNICTWQFILAPDGKFSAELNGNFIAEGNYEVTGNKIVIGVDSVCTDCSCAS